jgi:hypothetical protein
MFSCRYFLTDELAMTGPSGQSSFRADWLDFYGQTSLELHIRVCHRNVIAIDSPSEIQGDKISREGKDDQLAALR